MSRSFTSRPAPYPRPQSRQAPGGSTSSSGPVRVSSSLPTTSPRNTPLRPPPSVTYLSLGRRSHRTSQTPIPRNGVDVTPQPLSAIVCHPAFLKRNQRERTPREESTRDPECVDDADQIKRIISAVEATGTCRICSGFMVNPYSLGCGHSFCARCIRQSFEVDLRRNLEALKALKATARHDQHGPDECQAIPQSHYQLLRLVECLKFHRIPRRPIFQYRCPDADCDEVCTTSPRPNYELRAILEGIYDSLGNRFRPSLAEDEYQLFDGLIYTVECEPEV
ncbi:hypothetical protein DFP72DRAFT_862771 [Ephemerocybe angulata]|uniref:RING-type domain-containing protein n=1 Tax=Ephemerocybe angulata TaxID=980116 RepID=A0A8H6H7A2_9AGAR|nr:hypothetical protein DFP72DRAFT_862771 [Tulosesus angulatus]